MSLGDSALLVEFGNVISVELNEISVALSDRLTREPFPGFVESVPAYASTTIFYDIGEVRQHFPRADSAFEGVCDQARSALDSLVVIAGDTSPAIEIPFYFDEASAPDLAFVAEKNRLSEASVINIFAAATYRVFMLGFLPGFSYMGEVDDRIATPRKSTPRELVPKGSVGIAGNQTGIYSLDSPGGWQIIGRTHLEMFTPDAHRPCRLTPGDRVRFVPVER